MKVNSEIAFQNMQQTNARKDRAEFATQERVLEERRNEKLSLEKALEVQRLLQTYSYANVVRKTEGTVLDVEV